LYLQGKLKDHDCEYWAGLAEDYSGDWSQVEVLSTFIHSRVNAELMAKASNLKLIMTRSTGYDHIDLNACAERGITVVNVPSYGENTVAEYAFALLMAVARKIYEARDRAIRGNLSLEGLMGLDLQNKTLGVVGGGKIGINAIKIGMGFGMRVLCYDVKPNEELAKKSGFTYVELDKLYAEADFITLHVPLIPPTVHMINREAFAKMKNGVILINTARGGVIDTEAMVEALNDGKLAGAGLDVLEGEEWLTDQLGLASQEKDPEKLRDALQNHILMDHPNVVVTFHNAFNTREGRTRILDTTMENLNSFVAGKPVNLVERKK
jgi:D-lactate dehydrogenase